MFEKQSIEKYSNDPEKFDIAEQDSDYQEELSLENHDSDETIEDSVQKTQKETINYKKIKTMYHVDKKFNPVLQDFNVETNQVSFLSFSHLNYWIKKDLTNVKITIVQKKSIQDLKEKWILQGSKECLLETIDELISKLNKEKFLLKYQSESLQKFKSLWKENGRKLETELEIENKRIKPEIATAFRHLIEKIGLKATEELLQKLKMKAGNFVARDQKFWFNQNSEMLFNENGYAQRPYPLCDLIYLPTSEPIENVVKPKRNQYIIKNFTKTKEIWFWGPEDETPIFLEFKNKRLSKTFKKQFKLCENRVATKQDLQLIALCTDHSLKVELEQPNKLLTYSGLGSTIAKQKKMIEKIKSEDKKRSLPEKINQGNSKKIKIHSINIENNFNINNNFFNDLNHQNHNELNMPYTNKHSIDFLLNK